MYLNRYLLVTNRLIVNKNKKLKIVMERNWFSCKNEPLIKHKVTYIKDKEVLFSRVKCFKQVWKDGEKNHLRVLQFDETNFSEINIHVFVRLFYYYFCCE